MEFPINSIDGAMECRNITIIDDTVFEGPEEFYMVLASTTGVATVSNGLDLITIIDNEGITRL